MIKEDALGLDIVYVQAKRDADLALDYVKREARRPDQQQAVLDALVFKCDVLWAQLDAIDRGDTQP